MDKNSSQLFPTDAPSQWTLASASEYAGKGLMGPSPPNMAGGRRSRRYRKSRRSRKQSRKSRRSRR